jgi:murein L,D-transpeptidase YafK
MQSRFKNTLLSLLLLSTFTLSLSANALTQYRMYGIKDIEKQMDYDLKNREYWDDYLEDIDTQFGYIESYKSILSCDKSHSKLTLYMQDSEEKYKLKKSYSAFTGKMSGDKVKEGDLKTPVGIYNLTKKLSKLDSFYGPMAFVTSYPNTYDLYRKKDGSGIWIHGLPIDQERDSFTKGCIAINNSSIECLDRNINITETLLIINEKKTANNIKKEDLSDVLSQLFSWRYAWIYNDLTSYLNFYDSSFKRFDGVNLENFSRYKTRIFKKQEAKTIRFTDINVIPYPGEKDLYQITFFETYHSGTFSFSGNKVLIVKLKDNKIKIITEK